MLDRGIEALANVHQKTKEEIIDELRKNIPIGRIGHPDDVANLVSFLASKNSDYITGQSILVNGGTNFS